MGELEVRLGIIPSSVSIMFPSALAEWFVIPVTAPEATFGSLRFLHSLQQ